MPTGKPGTWEHGTESGYRACRKANGTACEPCKTAHREYNAERSTTGQRGGQKTAALERDATKATGRHRSTSTKPKPGYCTATTLEELLSAW